MTSLPATITQDTSEATTDALDAALNAQCGAPFTNASVWFTYTDPTGDGIMAQLTTDTSYSGGFLITRGDPTVGGQLVACGQGGAGVSGAPGDVYYIMAISDTAQNGGQLGVAFSVPAFPKASITVDPKGTAYKDGSAVITGTYTCSDAIDMQSWVHVSLSQRVGRVKIFGNSVYSPLQCNGLPHPWKALVTADNGLFSGGKAASVSATIACGPSTARVSRPTRPCNCGAADALPQAWGRAVTGGGPAPVFRCRTG